MFISSPFALLVYIFSAKFSGLEACSCDAAAAVSESEWVVLRNQGYGEGVSLAM